NDNDSATISLSGTPTVTEGANLTFTVTLSAASSTATTINYSFGGTAAARSDLTNTTTSVTIPALATTATITVPTTDDGLVEASETVTVTLLSVIGDPPITLRSPYTTLFRSNDNDSATISLSGTPTLTEGAVLAFTVTLSAASSTATTINYSFGGTA